MSHPDSPDAKESRMSRPAVDRHHLAKGLALERRNARSAFADELRYAAERLRGPAGEIR